MNSTDVINLETKKINIIKSLFLALFLFLVTLITAFYHLTGETRCILQEQEPRKEHPRNEERERLNEEQTTFEGNALKNSVSSCNLFAGRWAFDNMSNPLYEEGRCSFPMTAYACEKYGRKDLRYRNWRWQPNDCDLPRFNGTAFLEKIRGKKLIFVGDSLNRNQWTSMLCLIESSLDPSSPKSVSRKDNFFFFQTTEYNVTIGFYWSPFLVESNSDDPYIHRTKQRVVRIAAIEKHASHWTDADILIFDSFLWWQESPMTLLWGSFGSSDAIYKRVEMKLRLYEMGLNTWSDWLEININRTKSKLFFMSPSPTHLYGEDWSVHKYCYNETDPIFKEDYWGITIDRKMMEIAESVIQKLETRGLKLEYLNITHLSDYRKDAHPSIYRDFFSTLSEDQVANPRSYADCIHWCLPGVPDVWNQILYTYLMKSS